MDTFYLLTFDGELLFHNNCRPIGVVAKYKNFASELDVIKYIVETRCTPSAVGCSESDDSDDEYYYTEYGFEFAHLCKAVRLTRPEIRELPTDKLVDIISKKLDSSWKNHDIDSVAIVKETKLLKILHYAAGEDGIVGYKNPTTYVNPENLTSSEE